VFSPSSVFRHLHVILNLCVVCMGKVVVGGERGMSNVLKAIEENCLYESEASATASGCIVSPFVCCCSITLHLRTQ